MKTCANVLSAEQIDTLVSEYLNSECTGVSLGKKYGISKTAVYGLLKRRGIDRRPYGLFSDNDAKQIIDLYQNGQSTHKIAKAFKTNKTSVLNCLAKHGVERRDQFETSRKYPLNKDYFKNIDSEEKAYFLGLMYADGNVYYRKYSAMATIGLQDRDIDILKIFSQKIYGQEVLKNRKPKDKNHQPQTILTVSSNTFCDHLVKHGCVPCKSSVLSLIKIFKLSESLIFAFLKGFFDGDGCIYTTKKNQNDKITGHISFTSNRKVLKQLKKFFGRYGIRGHISMRKPLYGSFVIGKISNLKWFYDNIYCKSPETFLARKKEKFELFLESRNLL